MDVPLREYIEQSINALRGYVERRFSDHQREHELMDRANTVALANLNDRMQGINEFRGQLRDQAGTFVTRDVFDARQKSVDERLRTLSDAQIRRDSQLTLVAGVAGIVSSAATAVILRLAFG